MRRPRSWFTLYLQTEPVKRTWRVADGLGGDLGVVTISALASPIMGIVRGVKNGAAIHGIASAFVPIYGLIYFFAAEKR